MSDEDWPGEWRSGAEKMIEEADAMPDNENGVSFTNDHGTLYVVGDTDDADEWLFYEPPGPKYELRP